MKYCTLYTETATIHVPDTELVELPKGATMVPLRGYFAVVAVKDTKGEWIGWTNVCNHGYESVKDFMKRG